MNPLSIFCLVAILATATTVCGRSNSIRDNLKPTEWISQRELENTPSVDEITFERLQEMPAEEAAELVNKICKY